MEYKYKLGIDVDGVLRNLIHTFVMCIKVHYPEVVKSEVVSGWDFPNIDMPVKKKIDMLYGEFCEDVFVNGPSFEDAKSEFKKLKKWAKKNGVKLVCVTHQNEKTTGFTYKWLAKNEFIFKELHIVKYKANIDIDFLIDDGPHNYKEWIESKHRIPGTFFLMDRDWNREIETPYRISRLTDCIPFIEKII